MGLTYEQAKRCGIEHLWPTESKPLPAAPVPPSKAPDDGMNKLERAFWERARDAFGDDVYREPFKLRLAGRTWYTVDFYTCLEDVSPNDVSDAAPCGICWETKGHMRDDAAVKLKVAAEQYPFFRFVLVTRERRIWQCRFVTRAGFSREVWTPDWLR